MWPLLARELRAEARRPLSRWLRVMAAGACFLLLKITLKQLASPERVARELFPWLHSGMLAFPWLAAPLLTSELLAREKQEGTLAILLLTRLSIHTILAAKLLALTLRILSFSLAAVPILVFTIFFGGVSSLELRLALLLHATSLVLAISLSTLAAAWANTWLRATVTGLGFSLIGVTAGATILSRSFDGIIAAGFARSVWASTVELSTTLLQAGRLLSNHGGVWGETEAAIPATLVSAWLWLFASGLLLALLCLALCAVAARWLLLRNLGTSGPKREPTPVRRWFPISPTTRRRWLRRRPLRWLMRYPTEIRVARWVAAIIVAGVQGLLIVWHPDRHLWIRCQYSLGLLLCLGVTLVAAASYRRERFEGGFELLLTTPLKPVELAHARLGGLAWQFGPAWLVWTLGVLGYWPEYLPPSQPLGLLALAALVGIAAGAIGLESAFRFAGYWSAVGATAFLGPALGFFFGLPGLFDTDDWLGMALGMLVVGVNTALIWPDLQPHLHQRWVQETLLQGRHRIGLLHPQSRPRRWLGLRILSPLPEITSTPPLLGPGPGFRRRLRSSKPPRGRR